MGYPHFVAIKVPSRLPSGRKNIVLRSFGLKCTHSFRPRRGAVTLTKFLHYVFPPDGSQ